MPNVIEALLVTKGHAFEREPFFQLIDRVKVADPNTLVHWTHVEHPAAEAVLTPEGARPFDIVVFYDMPGVVFTNSEPPFAVYDPKEAFKRNFLALLDEGMPMVFLHHSAASWPTWPEYADVIGARFHFLPGEFNGQRYPGSGYRFRTQQTITVEDPDHPIVAGVGESFAFKDEVYLFPVNESEVTPLLRSDFEFEAKNFRYGGLGFKDHPTGSNLVGWTKTAYNSPIAYLQFGQDHVGYENPIFTTLLNNAIRWGVAESHRSDSRFQRNSNVRS